MIGPDKEDYRGEEKVMSKVEDAYNRWRGSLEWMRLKQAKGLDQIDEDDIFAAGYAAAREELREQLPERVVRDVAELPDRTSPEDWPEAMIVTDQELRDILEDALDDNALCSTCEGNDTITDPLTGEAESYTCPDCGGSGRADDALSP